MICVENEIKNTSEGVSVALSQDETLQLIVGLQRAMEEAKDHQTVWPLIIYGHQNKVYIQVGKD